MIKAWKDMFTFENANEDSCMTLSLTQPDEREHPELVFIVTPEELNKKLEEAFYAGRQLTSSIRTSDLTPYKYRSFTDFEEASNVNK